MERIASLKPASASPGLVKKALDQLGLESHEDYLSATDQAYGLLSASEQLISAGIANPTTRQKISVAMLQDSGCYMMIYQEIPSSNNLEHTTL